MLKNIVKVDLTSRCMVCPQPFNSREWPRQSFSLQIQYDVKKTSDNKEKYLLGYFLLIQYQIHWTNIIGTVQ